MRSWNWRQRCLTPDFVIKFCLSWFVVFYRFSVSEGSSSDLWVVLACTSRFWFNYRHVTNALSMYRVVKRLGVPDSRILLMLAEDIPCNARNALPGTVFKAVDHQANLCEDTLEVDFKGDEVTVENFARLLTGRHAPNWPLSKQMLSRNESRILVYLSGHGGDEFLKFHNHEEITSDDLAGILEDMKAVGRFSEMLFMVDTCQAGTLFNKFRTPGVLSIGSSAKGENSYAHQNDLYVGAALVDRFTDAFADYILRYMHRIAPSSASDDSYGPHPTARLDSLLSSMSPEHLVSTPVVSAAAFPRPLAKVEVAHFFAGAPQVTLLKPKPVGASISLLGSSRATAGAAHDDASKREERTLAVGDYFSTSRRRVKAASPQVQGHGRLEGGDRAWYRQREPMLAGLVAVSMLLLLLLKDEPPAEAEKAPR